MMSNAYTTSIARKIANEKTTMHQLPVVHMRHTTRRPAVNFAHAQGISAPQIAEGIAAKPVYSMAEKNRADRLVCKAGSENDMKLSEESEEFLPIIDNEDCSKTAIEVPLEKEHMLYKLISTVLDFEKMGKTRRIHNVREVIKDNWDNKACTEFDNKLYTLLKKSHTDITLYPQIKSMLKPETKIKESTADDLLFLAAKFSAYYNTDETKFMDVLIDKKKAKLVSDSIFRFKFDSNLIDWKTGKEHETFGKREGDKVIIRKVNPLIVASLFCFVYEMEHPGQKLNTALLDYLLEKGKCTHVDAVELNAKCEIVHPYFYGAERTTLTKVMTILDFMKVFEHDGFVRQFLESRGAKTFDQIRKEEEKKTNVKRSPDKETFNCM